MQVMSKKFKTKYTKYVWQHDETKKWLAFGTPTHTNPIGKYYFTDDIHQATRRQFIPSSILLQYHNSLKRIQIEIKETIKTIEE